MTPVMDRLDSENNYLRMFSNELVAANAAWGKHSEKLQDDLAQKVLHSSHGPNRFLRHPHPRP